MIKVEEPSCMSVCVSCGKKYENGFIKIHIAGGASYYSKYIVLCKDCANELKDMLCNANNEKVVVGDNVHTRSVHGFRKNKVTQISEVDGVTKLVLNDGRFASSILSSRLERRDGSLYEKGGY